MKFWWVIFFVLMLAFIALHTRGTPKDVPDSVLNSIASSENQNCRNKTRCIVVYMTPWCPTCKATVPVINAMLETPPAIDTGVIAIVGGDSKARIDDTREELGGAALADYDSALARALGVRAIPHWFVWSADGKILRSVSAGAIADEASPAETASDFAKDVLGLD